MYHVLDQFHIAVLVDVDADSDIDFDSSSRRCCKVQNHCSLYCQYCEYCLVCWAVRNALRIRSTSIHPHRFALAFVADFACFALPAAFLVATRSLARSLSMLLGCIPADIAGRY